MKMKSPFGTNGAYSLTSLSLPLTLLNDDGDSDSDTTEYLNDDPSFPLQIPVITYMEGLYKATDRINSQHGLIRFFASFLLRGRTELRDARMGIRMYVMDGENAL